MSELGQLVATTKEEDPLVLAAREVLRAAQPRLALRQLYRHLTQHLTGQAEAGFKEFQHKFAKRPFFSSLERFLGLKLRALPQVNSDACFDTLWIMLEGVVEVHFFSHAARKYLVLPAASAATSAGLTPLPVVSWRSVCRTDTQRRRLDDLLIFRMNFVVNDKGVPGVLGGRGSDEHDHSEGRRRPTFLPRWSRLAGRGGEAGRWFGGASRPAAGGDTLLLSQEDPLLPKGVGDMISVVCVLCDREDVDLGEVSMVLVNYYAHHLIHTII